MQWNNFANFKAVFQDETFWQSLKKTLLLLTTQFIGLFIALVTSTLLSQKFRGTKFFTVLFFVPYICSSVAISIMWMTMFNNDYGVINELLVQWFGEGAKVNWYKELGPSFAMIFIISIWQAPGYGIVMFNAAFTQVPKDLYEAASLDGANKFRQFIHITLPSIRPTTFFLIMAGIISGLQAFAIPKLLSDALGNSWTGAAGPDNAGLTSMLYVYNTGFVNNRIPQAAVMSFILFVIIMTLTIINFRIERRNGDG
jgi:multiple sugar transport system permease protein